MDRVESWGRSSKYKLALKLSERLGPYRGRIKQLNLNSPVFTEKRHREAMLAKICERENANIAATNYYFRDKATLYAEAWRMCVIQRSC